MDDEPTSTGKFLDSTDWRDKFAEFIQEERRRAELSIHDFPTPSTLAEAEWKASSSEAARSVLRAETLLRWLIWLRSAGKHRPSPERLHALLLLWVLATLEHLPEQPSFQEKLAKHYESRFDREKTIYSVFKENWDKGGKKVQRRLRRLLVLTYKKLIAEPKPAGAESAAPPTARPLKVEPPPEGAPPTPLNHLPTLDLFPEDFKPLVVIVGGYAGPIQREPEHISELFRQSQSFVNLYYLPRLRLDPDTVIVSDRLLLELHDDRARAAELLGRRHILVIGGPLLDSVSRHLMLTKRLIFNFAFPPNTYRFARDFRDFYDDIKRAGLLDTGDAVRLFYRMMDMAPHELELTPPELTEFDMTEADRQKIKDLVVELRRLSGKSEATNHDITELFRPTYMFSPLWSTLAPLTADTNHEFAVISLGDNLWANLLRQEDKTHPRYALIAVSGINRLSTALAVKALSHAEALHERPFGGLLEVAPDKAIELKQVTNTNPKWLTKPYQAPSVLQKIDQSMRAFDERPDAFTLFEMRRELERYREMVAQYVEPAP
ncbi:MAG TPA: hypothetical protein VF546_23515 [Pyrinomonadaceae bacterium]